MFGQITGQSHGVQFIDSVHIFGNGCAVTKRGAPPATSIYHAVRTFKLVPSGAVSRPSTTKRLPCFVISVSTTSFSRASRSNASANFCHSTTVKPNRRKNHALL